MAIFKSKAGAKSAKKVAKKAKRAGKAATNASEAKALLVKMQAKKDAGDCPFC